MKRSSALLAGLLVLSLVLVMVPYRASAVSTYTLSNGAITINLDSFAQPRTMMTPRAPTSAITGPGHEFLYYSGIWHPFGNPTTIVQTSPTTLVSTYAVGPYTVVRVAQLLGYPALLLTYKVTSSLGEPSVIGFHFSVDYHPGSAIPSLGNSVEPIFLQFSSINLPYGSSIPNRYNGSNIAVMQMNVNQFDFLAIDGRFPGRAALGSAYPGVYSAPPVNVGNSVLGGDQAIAVEILGMNVGAGGSVTFRASMGQDITLKLAQTWAWISTR